MYIYWDYIAEKDGNGPSLEEFERASIVLAPGFADYEKEPPFVIAETDYKSFQELEQYHCIQKAPVQLQELLISSVSYPPALAFVRRDIDKLNLSEMVTKEEFTDIVTNLLRKYLERQTVDQFLLIEFLSSNIISGAFLGNFVWVVGYTPKIKLIHYVGHDYFIYSDHISCFKLTEQQIEKLPVEEMKEYILIDHVNKKQAEFDLTDESLDFDEISEIIRVVRLNNAKSYSKNELKEN